MLETSQSKRKVTTFTTDDEPPSTGSAQSGPDEPPRINTRVSAPAGRKRFFSQVSDEDWNDWRWQFRNRITTLDEISKYIPFTREAKERLEVVVARYPMAITPYYLSLIDPDDPDDPIRKQSVPCFEEIACINRGKADPLEEGSHSPVPGVVHRYPDRSLFVLTDLCPMFCRHCTRKREWKNGIWTRTMKDIEPMLDYVRKTPTLRDVIISGGDPLTLSTSRLEEVISKLKEIPHVEIIRIGSRFPVVLPQRINKELCDMLSKYSGIWFNTHFNHPREVTPEAAQACERLVKAGVPVNNQSVLLKGINNSVEVYTKLCQELLKIRVRPYYLFQCDEVEGTEHLWTPVEDGINIIDGMRGHTSGLAIPTYVIDLANGGGKVPLQPNYLLSQTEDNLLVLRNYQGHIFSYQNPGSSRKELARKASKNERKGQLLFPEMAPLLKGRRPVEDRTVVRPQR
jgi:lysine 2,3-aminomutase